MADARRVYIDACCFIDMVKIKVGRHVAGDRELDVWMLKKLLEANRDREVVCFTSTLTIAECSHDGEQKVSAETKSEFTRLLTSGQYVQLVQVTPFIALDARDLRWTHDVRLRGADAIHVASALAMKCEELFSSNSRIERLSHSAGALSRLGLTVRRGKDTVCLPDKYKQLELDNGKNGSNGKGKEARIEGRL